MVLNAVVQLNHAILEALEGVQVQWHVAVTPRDQGNAISDEDRDHTDDEFVDRLLVEKGSDEVAAAHQPDVLAGLRSQAAREWGNGTGHELHAWRGIRRWRLTGEDDVPSLRVELRPQVQARLEALPAEDLRVDRPREGVHAVGRVGGGARAGRQPIEISVWTRDEPVRTGSDVHD